MAEPKHQFCGLDCDAHGCSERWPGVRDDDFAMTSATKFLFAKFRLRASNQGNQKASGGTRRVYSQIDGKRQGGLG
jgi:hypothetical protein